MNTFEKHFEGFKYTAQELSAYIYCVGTFIIALKSGEIIKHESVQPELFQQWLQHHKIRDVRDTLSTYIYNNYFLEKKN